MRRGEAVAWGRAGLPAGLLLLALAGPVAAQTGSGVRGEVAVLGLTMPGREATELRTRVGIDATVDPRPWLRLKIDGVAEGLVAERQGRVTDGLVRLREAWLEVRGDSADLRVGYGRLAWGRLDEIQPSDVLNPIDTSQYFLEGRASARLPIAFARGRVYLPGQTAAEVIVSLPGRRSRFDLLDESSSPFNLSNDLVVIAAGGRDVRREEPAASWSTVQGGARLSVTRGRVDMSASIYRGFESFGVVAFEPLPTVAGPAAPPGLTVVGELVERYPRFTMVAADMETVVGAWAVRAEAAYFPRRSAAGAGEPDGRRVMDLGIGLDRSAGDYHVFGSIVWHREWTVSEPTVPAAPGDDTDVSVIASVERRLSRDRFLLRVFGVGNPVDESAFVRGLVSWSVRDSLLLDVSGGLFAGPVDGTDTLSRYRERDFLFSRIRWLF